MTATTPTTTTDSTWDVISGGSIPLDINDAATTSGTTTNTSYLYGNLLFGGVAPVEQISGSTATFLVVNPTGVQGVFSSSGAVDELAIYSVYGKQTVASGTKVTPFGFQGSYSDPTGLIYLVNRYYDPTADQFLSVDPDIGVTNQPYVFINDDPLNAEDPLGECGGLLGWVCSGFDATRHYLASHASVVVEIVSLTGAFACLFATVGTAAPICAAAAASTFTASVTATVVSNRNPRTGKINIGKVAAAVVFDVASAVSPEGSSQLIRRLLQIINIATTLEHNVNGGAK